MAALRPDTSPQILSLSEQLDAMLHGWLERRSTTGEPVPPEASGAAVITVATALVDEVKRFCALWGMRLDQVTSIGGWTAVRVSGPRLPVIGFSEITAMYRR